MPTVSKTEDQQRPTPKVLVFKLPAARYLNKALAMYDVLWKTAKRKSLASQSGLVSFFEMHKEFCAG